MTVERIQPGMPAGGQFATRSRTPATDVDLDLPAPSTPTDATTQDTWTPQYEPWRHGGWYVVNDIADGSFVESQFRDAALTFKDCLFDDDPIIDLNTEWPSGFDPQENAQFRRTGIDADEQARWNDHGFNDASEVKAWKDAWFEPAEADSWRKQGFAADSAEDYRNFLLTPDESAPYLAAGLSGWGAANWKAAGFHGGPDIDPSEDVAQWASPPTIGAATIGPRSAAKWAGAHYTASEAHALVRAGHVDPSTAPPPIRASRIAEHYGTLKSTLRAAELRTLHAQLTARRPQIGSDDEAKLAAIDRIQSERRRRHTN